MRILLVNDYGTPTGGAETQMLALRDELRRRGHDARLFASSARPLGAESLADYDCVGTTSRFRTLLQTANPWAARAVRRILAEFRPDVVHVRLFLTQLSPLILPPLRDVPSLYHVVWYRPICPLGTKMLPDGAACHAPAGLVCYRQGCLPLRDWAPLMLQMKVWRRWRHHFGAIVANSEAVKRRLSAEGIEVAEVIPNGVPIRLARLALSPPPTVAFAGRLVPEKGVDVLLRAFARVVPELPAARLLLAGDGPERDHLGRLIVGLRLSSQVAMLGHLPPDELERQLGGAWLQAVPSRWEEPFANVALEAMMRGTAVVASSTGGLTEIVRHGHTGLLVPPSDPDALAAALLELLREQESAERMGRAGREVAQAHFSATVVADTFLRLYEAMGRNRAVAHGN